MQLQYASVIPWFGQVGWCHETLFGDGEKRSIDELQRPYARSNIL